MIDPKFNELPVRESPAGVALEQEEPVQSRTPREGLSIRDTIAGDANLSDGSPGVDTSGVRAGAGAAAGSSWLTPSTTESPAPELVSGARQSGTTVASLSTNDDSSGYPGSDAALDDFTHEETSARAYDCWYQRGCPHGSAHVDWDLAQEQLRAERRRPARARAAAASA
jgi:hypothetical protein